MKKYTFLLKPIFFIFSLLFATWLVFEIEQISPSDFGMSQSAIAKGASVPKSIHDRRQYLMDLCSAYKAGAIDSAKLNQKLIIFLKGTESPVVK